MRLKELRLEHKLTQEEASKIANVSRSSYTHYETGRRTPDIDTLLKFAKYYNVTIDYLLGNDVIVESNVVNADLDRKTKTIKVLGQVPAGIPIEAIENFETEEEIPASWHGDYFGLKIKGDSMSPKYLDGDIVIFKHYNGDVDSSGMEALVYVNGYDATFKKVIKDNGHYVLQSINPEYPPMIVDKDETFTVAGIPVELRRSSL